jgi:hypothetical protein
LGLVAALVRGDVDTPGTAQTDADLNPTTAAPAADSPESGSNPPPEPQTVQRILVERGEISVPGVAYLDGREPGADPPRTVMDILVWESPSLTGSSCQLNHGAQVSVLDAAWDQDEEHHAFHIAGDSCRGWVVEHFVGEEYEKAIGEEVHLEGGSQTPELVAGEDGVNVRAGPGLAYGIVGSLKPGASATITGRHSDWLRIEYGGADAWVAGWVVSSTGADTVPHVDPTGEPPTRESPLTATAAPQPEQDSACTPDADFDDDVSFSDNTRIEAGKPFVKTWRVINTGTCAWGPAFRLSFVAGEQMSGPAEVSVPEARPGESVEVSVELVAPSTPGAYRGDWQMVSDAWGRFGSMLYVQILVADP